MPNLIPMGDIPSPCQKRLQWVYSAPLQNSTPMGAFRPTARFDSNGGYPAPAKFDSNRGVFRHSLPWQLLGGPLWQGACGRVPGPGGLASAAGPWGLAPPRSARPRGDWPSSGGCPWQGAWPRGVGLLKPERSTFWFGGAFSNQKNDFSGLATPPQTRKMTFLVWRGLLKPDK